MERAAYVTHVTNLAVFLIYQEKYDPKAMFGSRRIRDAVNSLAAIMQVDPAYLREKMLLDEPKPGDDRHD